MTLIWPTSPPIQTTDSHHLRLRPDNGGIHVAKRVEFPTVGDMNAFTNEVNGVTGTPVADDLGTIAQVGTVVPFSFWILVDHTVPTWLPFGGLDTQPLYFGAGSLNPSVVTRYLYPNYSDRIAETSPANEVRVVKSGNLQNLYVVHNVLGSPTVVITYTVLVNGVPSALAVGIAADAALGANTSTQVPVVAGDRISVRATKPSPVTSPRKIHVSMEVL